MQKAPAPLRDDDMPSEDVLRRMRIPFIRRASLTWDAGSEDVFMVDLALTGAFVERSAPLALGSDVELRFQFPDNEIPVVATGRVAWWRGPDTPRVSKSLPVGLGVEFTSFSPADEGRLRQYLAEYYRRHPRTRRFVSHE
jgi:Tfp pilus assembly protein PilZ